MLNHKEFRAIAIIPARGGSKSIPLKNIKPLCGKPLIFYTIFAALESNLFERVIVSTDSQEIAEVSKTHGAEVLMRPLELAQDHSPTEDALIHVLDSVESEGINPTVVMTLEPTAPLRGSETLKGIIELYKNTDADSVMTLEQEHECHFQLKDKKVEFLIKDQPRRRQDREPIYKENGGTYLTEVSVLRNKRKVFGDNLYGYVLPAIEALDINELLDFYKAEALIQYGK